MQLSKGRWMAIGLVVLVAALIGHGRVLVTDSLDVERQYVDAFGLSIAAPAFVLFSALGTSRFDFDRYTRDRGRTGLALDATVIVAICLVISSGVATLLDAMGVGTSLLVAILALVVYLSAFAVFTVRASDHYDRLPT